MSYGQNGGMQMGGVGRRSPFGQSSSIPPWASMNFGGGYQGPDGMSGPRTGGNMTQPDIKSGVYNSRPEMMMKPAVMPGGNYGELAPGFPNSNPPWMPDPRSSIMGRVGPPQTNMALTPWERNPNDQNNYPGGQFPQGQPRTGGVFTVNEPQITPFRSFSEPPSYQQTAQAPGAQLAGQTEQQWQDQNAGLLRKQTVQDPALKAGPAIPPRPTGQMQPGQADWQFNAGTNQSYGGAPGLPNGWTPGFLPGAQSYISRYMPGLTPEQMGMIDWNNVLGSMAKIPGVPSYDSVRHILG